jgi:hypothetical protein
MSSYGGFYGAFNLRVNANQWKAAGSSEVKDACALNDKLK